MAAEVGATAAPERVRTWLFAPADAPERCRKALASRADQVIWDLEDAVAPTAKARARAALGGLLAGAAGAARAPWVRIGSPLEEAGLEDLALLEAHGALGRLVLPKAEARSVAALARVRAEGRWLLIVESARGLWDLAAGRLAVPAAVEARLAFGGLDYALDVGIGPEGGEDALLHARSQIVWLSRVLGLGAPIDTVYPSFTDAAGLAESARRAYGLGFAGKLAIHPAQLDAIEGAFTPAAATVAWARRVVAAAAGGAGALSVDGAMVDRPVVERARAVLAAAGDGTQSNA